MKQSTVKQVVPRSQTGFTMVELLIATTILSLIIAMVTSLIVSTYKNQDRLRVENMMRTEAERSLFGLANKLNQSRMLMGNDPSSPNANNVGLGNAYRQNLDLTAAPAPISSSYLPIIRAEGSLAPEKDCTASPNNFFRANTVGNALLFARYIGRFSNFTLTAGTDKRNLDLYEFKYIYITDDSTAVSGAWYSNMWFIDRWYKNPPVLRRQRLIEWTSKRYIDYDQFSDYIGKLGTTDRTTLRAALTNADIQGAWRRSGTTYSGGSPDIFYDIGSGNSATVAAKTSTTVSPYKIAQFSVSSLLKFDRDNYSIAYNKQPASGTARYFPIRNEVPYFYNPAPPACGGVLPAPSTTKALNTTAADSFPRGFEVMIVGPASGRSVQMRITTVASINKSLVDHADSTTAFARDL